MGAASLLSTLDKLSMPMPRCVALMSPWTDLSNGGLHHVDVSSYTGCDYLPPQVVQWFSKQACGRLPDNQLPASPIYAEGSFVQFGAKKVQTSRACALKAACMCPPSSRSVMMLQKSLCWIWLISSRNLMIEKSKTNARTTH